jgi:hypothetical protein
MCHLPMMRDDHRRGPSFAAPHFQQNWTWIFCRLRTACGTDVSFSGRPLSVASVPCQTRAHALQSKMACLSMGQHLGVRPAAVVPYPRLQAVGNSFKSLYSLVRRRSLSRNIRVLTWYGLPGPHCPDTIEALVSACPVLRQQWVTNLHRRKS